MTSRKFLILPFVVTYIFSQTTLDAMARNSGNNEDVSQAIKQEFLLHEGDQFVEQGHYSEAFEIYLQALGPQYVRSALGMATPLYRLISLHRLLGDYDQALDYLDEFMKIAVKPGGDRDVRRELNALKQYASTGNPQYVRDHAQWLRETYKKALPPNGYGSTNIEISTILRLYDTIGDHDAGIAFIDEILAYFRTGKAGDPKPGRVDAEYLKVRKAFELDKAEGKKGRATRALIESDYFPW